MNIFLFLGGAFLIVSVLGRLLEKIRIPWIFAALFLGLVLAGVPSVALDSVDKSETFVFLANLGMYFLLFRIGYDLDFKGLRKLGTFIMKATFSIIFFEALLGSVLVHYVFGYEWLTAIIVSLSFATVGEAILVPILDEFKLTKTKLGQTILGVATFDDVIEILLIVLITVLFPLLQQEGDFSPMMLVERMAKPLMGLGVLVLIVSFLLTFNKRIKKFKTHSLETSFFFLIAAFFIFLGIANFVSVEMSAIGAVMAGMVVNNFLPSERKDEIEKELRAISYGFLAPIFFLWVGLETDVSYLIESPFLIFLLIGVTYMAKIFASYLIGRKKLGTRQSLFMGVALGVRFSTSIVIIKFLYENDIIQSELYSILIGSTIAFKFIVPFVLANLVNRWKITGASIRGEAKSL